MNIHINLQHIHNIVEIKFVILQLKKNEEGVFIPKCNSFCFSLFLFTPCQQVGLLLNRPVPITVFISVSISYSISLFFVR